MPSAIWINLKENSSCTKIGRNWFEMTLSNSHYASGVPSTFFAYLSQIHFVKRLSPYQETPNFCHVWSMWLKTPIKRCNESLMRYQTMTFNKASNFGEFSVNNKILQPASDFDMIGDIISLFKCCYSGMYLDNIFDLPITTSISWLTGHSFIFPPQVKVIKILSFVSHWPQRRFVF